MPDPLPLSSSFCVLLLCPPPVLILREMNGGETDGFLGFNEIISVQ